MGLDPRKHVGKSLQEMRPLLRKLNAQFGLHECGEGGEYESLVLDSPLVCFLFCFIKFLLKKTFYDTAVQARGCD